MIDNKISGDAEDLRIAVEKKGNAEKELLQAKKDLEESNARFQAIMSTTVDGIIIINDQGIVQTYNQAAENIFGYSKDEIMGQNISMLMPSPYSLEHNNYIQKYLKTKTSKILGQCREMVAKRKDGLIIPIDLSVNALEFDDKTIFAGLVRDISKRKKSEADLREQTDALEKSNQELEQFAYIASHDLQEPLRMISSYLNLLSRRYAGKLDEDADEFINYAVDGAQRLQKQINDLLAYSRVGTRGGSLKPVDTNEVLKRVLENLKINIEENDAEIQLDEFPTILGDESQLIQLFQNLIGNALKFHANVRPVIEIMVKKKIKLWQFTVKDNGIGIDPEYKDRIFQIFQRLHTREEYPGTGIGLAICRKIVERHGGTIWVYSEPGKGCSFNFTLTGTESEKETYETGAYENISG